MAVTRASFIVRFPEFATISEPLVTAKIAEASNCIDGTVWGALADDGVAYLAAHRLALSPLGEQAKLQIGDKGSNQTVYGDEYEKLRAIVGIGFVLL